MLNVTLVLPFSFLKWQIGGSQVVFFVAELVFLLCWSLCRQGFLLPPLPDQTWSSVLFFLTRVVLTNVCGRGNGGRRLRTLCRRRERLRPSCCGPTSQTSCSRPKRKSQRWGAQQQWKRSAVIILNNWLFCSQGVKGTLFFFFSLHFVAHTLVFNHAVRAAAVKSQCKLKNKDKTNTNFNSIKWGCKLSVYSIIVSQLIVLID